jgi:hypothetical protein
LKLRLHLHEIIPLTIREHPELPALAILDAALHAATNTLLAEHPEIGDRNSDALLHPATYVAENIVNFARCLHDAIGSYARLVGDARQLEMA